MKRAIAVTELTVLLLALAAGFGLLWYTKEGADKAACARDITLCKESFVLFKKVQEKAAIEPKINCRSVSPPNCDNKVLPDDKQQAMFIIAENLRSCWEKTLGNQNTMGESLSYVLPVPVVGISNLYDFCMVCSEFEPSVDISAQEWGDYFNMRKVPKTQSTYAEYITPNKETVFGKGFNNVAFQKGKHYYVVSVSAEATFPYDIAPVGLYVDSELTCGEKKPQIHYQVV
jgi:hypothetical protein